LSSAINKLKDRLKIERNKTVPFTKWSMTKEFITTRDDIVDTHKDIDQEDLKYFRNIEEMMRGNKKDFNNEYDKRYKYVMAKFI